MKQPIDFCIRAIRGTVCISAASFRDCREVIRLKLPLTTAGHPAVIS
jgi:hypothetical protein